MLRDLPERLGRTLIVSLRFLRARQRMPRLVARAEGTERTLLVAIDQTLRLRNTPEEREVIARIESLRRQLDTSRRVITRTIYGLPPEHPHPRGEAVPHGRRVTETVGAACRRASRQRFWCLLLFRLVRMFRPAACLELGTSLGMTAAYQAAALRLNRSGRIVTLEGDAVMASLAEDNFRSLELDAVSVVAGRIQETLPRVLDALRPLDYVFIDADKDESAVLGYFEQLYPCLASRALLVFDDIHWSPAMERAWTTICGDARVTVSVDLIAMGICVVEPGAAHKAHVDIPIG